jgi:hypothetical protein
VAFAALGAVAARGIAWWPAVAIVTLTGISVHARTAARAARGLPADMSASAKRRTPPGNSWNNHIALTLALTCIAAMPVWRPVNPITEAPDNLLGYAPEFLTEVLAESAGPDDRIWNAQVWGSWLEFRVPAPAYAFDSRVEVIPSKAWADNDVVLAAGPGWAEILDRYDATVIVAEGDLTAPLAAALDGSAEWFLLYVDDDGTIWRRASESTAAAGLSSRP